MSGDSIEILKRLVIEQISGIRMGDVLLMFAVLALLVLIPGYLLTIKKGIPYRWFVHTYFTLCYLGLILFVTIIRREVGSRAGRKNLYVYFGSLSGDSLSKRVFLYCVLNVLLFVPWGFLVYRFLRKGNWLKGVILTTLIGFSTSVMIEVIQYITGTGVFEYTDIVTNTAGAFCGAGFCAFISYCIESCDY